MKFVQLIIRKIIKIISTRCHILRLKCTKFDSDWGFAPDPAGGAYSAPPDHLAGFRGPYTSMGREWRGRREEGSRRAHFSLHFAEYACCDYISSVVEYSLLRAV